MGRSIGLRINSGPGTLNLSGLFKSAVADPDLAIKGALANAQIWGMEHENALRDQQAEAQRQAGIKAAQEAADLKAKADAIAGGVDPIAAMYQEQITRPRPTDQPVPVDVARIAGPVNGVPVTAAPIPVTPEQMTRYDAEVAAQPAIVRNILYGGGNAAQVAAGIGRGAGVAGLLEKSDPDTMRRNAILATGSLPTKDTMLSSEDTAPMRFAAADAAAKASAAANTPQIVDLGGRGKARITAAGSGDAELIGNTQPGLTKENAAQVLAVLTAQEKIRPLTNEQAAIRDQARLLAATPVAKETTLYGADAAGVAPLPGQTARLEDTGMLAGLNNNDAAFLRKMLDVSVKVRSDPNYKPDEQTLQEFDTGYTQVFRQGSEVLAPSKVAIPERDIQIGDPVLTQVKPELVPSLISPQELYARAGRPYPGAVPAAGGPDAVVSPPAATVGPAPPAGLEPSSGPIVSGPGGYSVAPGSLVAPEAGVAPAVAPAVNAAAAAGQGRTTNNMLVDVGPAASAFRNGGVYVQKLANGSGAPATEAEGKLRGYAGRAVFGTAYLDQIVGGRDIPDFLTQYFNNPANGDLTSEYIQSQADPATKNYMAFATWFITAALRKDSGAAITRDEYLLYREFLPRPGDSPQMLRARTEARHGFIRDALRDGYTTDARGRQMAEDEAQQFGVKLAADFGSITATPEMEALNAAREAADAGKAPAGVDQQDWIDLGREGRAKFNAAGRKGP